MLSSVLRDEILVMLPILSAAADGNSGPSFSAHSLSDIELRPLPSSRLRKQRLDFSEHPRPEFSYAHRQFDKMATTQTAM